jgi:transglutaminase-like putative cysteine protease
MIVFRNWQRNLSQLLWTVFLLQFVIWFSEYWLTDTETIVKAVLWSILLIEIIVPLHWIIRRFLQLTAIVSIHIVVLDIQFTGISIDSISTFFSTIYTHAVNFHPFIWFAIGTWLIYLIVVSWIKTKGALYSVIISSIILFAIIDSFTFYILWNQVAMIILCGLLLAVIQHFDEFKIKHPASWQYFNEYPGTIITLVIIIISVTMAAGIMAPNIRPLIIDPYTAWKHSQGEAVQTFGKGYDGFTAAALRDSTSGYRRDDTSLGGSFKFDYAEVMKVNTNHRTYLRGETRSVYTGLGWEASDSEANAMFDNMNTDTELNVDPNLDTSNLETFEVEQRIRMISDTVYPVLFGAYSIQRLEAVDEGEGPFPNMHWSPQNSVLHWDVEEDKFPEAYNLVSQMPILDVNGLREVSVDSVNASEMEEYLQIPDDLPDRVSDLAIEITEAETNQYDIVKSIEYHLSLFYPYTNEPDLDKGTSDDFVDRFLFEIEEGYCDYYSTSMVVLTRSLGIPARWVKGYSSGVLPSEEYEMFMSPEELDLDPNAGGEYTIRNADAHSWVEVYFEGWGWIPFEPTAGFSLPTVLPEDDESTDFLPQPTELEPVEETGVMDKLTTPLNLFIIISIAILFIPILLYFRRLNLFAFFKEMRRNRKDLPQNQKVITEFNRFIRFAGKKGYTREDHETVREMVARWVENNKWLVKDLEGLMSIFERAKYSHFTITHDEYHNAIRICKKLREEMK